MVPKTLQQSFRIFLSQENYSHSGNMHKIITENANITTAATKEDYAENKPAYSPMVIGKSHLFKTFLAVELIVLWVSLLPQVFHVHTRGQWKERIRRGKKPTNSCEKHFIHAPSSPKKHLPELDKVTVLLILNYIRKQNKYHYSMPNRHVHTHLHTLLYLFKMNISGTRI